jgi:hypothetical protein
MVTICDVGPRDGLQNEQAVLEPAVRAELVNRLAAVGLPAIEAVSFVHPERVLPMAGAEEVVAGIERRADVVYSASRGPTWTSSTSTSPPLTASDVRTRTRRRTRRWPPSRGSKRSGP